MNDTSPYPYHKSISAWYNTFLKVALQRKAWPVDAYAEESDFEPVFQKLQDLYPNKTVKEIGDDQWAENFIYTGMALFHTAEDFRLNTTDGSTSQESITYYRRAANVFKLAYFPWVHEKTSPSKAKQYAWSMDKKAFELAIDLMDSLDYSEDSTSTLDGNEVDDTDDSDNDADGYETGDEEDEDDQDDKELGRESQAKEEYWSTIVNWIEAQPGRFNADCISFWGISTGSYWALRVSRVEKDRVRRAVSQGTASHYTFTGAWLEAAENLAYPASLQRALSQAFGYPDPESFKKDVEQFSLLRQGLLDQGGTRVVAVNGEKDTIFPIDDQRILTEHGPGAWLRWFPHMGHNGEPLSSAWLLRYWEQCGGC
ncbi:hypothetical protein NDA16_003054 [Ustilago loliicola]|nr:hypothetical protein NDA16_003054 [Ustilago loliicola]